MRLRALLSVCVYMCVLHGSWCGDSACQDIDQDACVTMATQNPNMCSDPILSTSVCPNYCHTCPITCLSCNTTTPDVSSCNLITCGGGQFCMKTESSFDGEYYMRLKCATKQECAGLRRRGVASRDVHIHCCAQDHCNDPTKQSTLTSQTTSIHSTFQHHAATTATSSGTGGCTRDLIIMIEDSSILGGSNINLLKQFAKNLISKQDVGYNRTRIALGAFESYGRTIWELDSYFDKTAMLDEVDKLSPLTNEEGSNLGAIEHVIAAFGHGNRDNVEDVVVIVSEAHMLDELPHFLLTGHLGDYPIRVLKQLSHDVIAVAFGHANQNQLQSIATDEAHYMYLPYLIPKDLSDIANRVQALICSN